MNPCRNYTTTLWLFLNATGAEIAENILFHAENATLASSNAEVNGNADILKIS